MFSFYSSPVACFVILYSHLLICAIFLDISSTFIPGSSN